MKLTSSLWSCVAETRLKLGLTSEAVVAAQNAIATGLPMVPAALARDFSLQIDDVRKASTVLMCLLNSLSSLPTQYFGEKSVRRTVM